MPRLSIALVCLFLGSVFVACDSADPTPEPVQQLGESSVSISGVLNRSFEGVSFWTAAEDEAGSYTVLVLFNGNEMPNVNAQRVEYVLIPLSGPRPNTGDHIFPSVDAPERGMGYFQVDPTTPRRAEITEGVLSVTGSSPDRLEGTISFSGPYFVVGDQTLGPVEIEGRLDAPFIDASDVPYFNVGTAARVPSEAP